MPAYTFETVGPAIEAHIKRAVAGAVSMGLAPEIATTIADTGRVKSGRMTASVTAGKSSPPDGDVGKAPGSPDQYPPRHFAVKARSEHEGELRGAKFGEKLYVTDYTPYASVWAERDNWIDISIGMVERKWPAVAEEGARRAK